MISIIDYNAGNISSLRNAVETLGYSTKIVSTEKDILHASKLIFPGQGRAGSAMEELQKKNLLHTIEKIQVPFLGICLGMQLLTEETEEDGHKGFGIFSSKTKKFTVSLPIPQMGWNAVRLKKKSLITENIKDEDFFYFANSYYVEISDTTIGYGIYGNPFSAIEQKNNFYAVQFHPEKSGKSGITLLDNFCSIC